VEHLSSQKTPDQVSYNYQIQQNQNDEIDLKELFVSLWEGKVIIILMSLAFFTIAVAYSLSIEEKWEANAKIAQPELSQFRFLKNQIGQYQPVFDTISSIDGSIGRSDILDDFVSPKTLLDTFVQQFSNRNNKKSFLEKHSEFKLKLESLKKTEDEEVNKATEQKLYHSWYKKLAVIKEAKAKGDETTDVYYVTSELDTAGKSFDLLVGYLGFIDQKAREVVQGNLHSVIASKKNELLQQISFLKEQARSRLLVEKLRSEHEFKIAKSAGVLRPLENYNVDQSGVFSINLGADALGAKVQVLSDLKSLSLFEPMIVRNEAKLSLLNSLLKSKSIDFQVMQYIEKPEKPYELSAPNRSGISILGGALGASLGMIIILIGVTFRKREKAILESA